MGRAGPGGPKLDLPQPCGDRMAPRPCPVVAFLSLCLQPTCQGLGPACRTDPCPVPSTGVRCWCLQLSLGLPYSRHRKEKKGRELRPKSRLPQNSRQAGPGVWPRASVIRESVVSLPQDRSSRSPASRGGGAGRGRGLVPGRMPYLHHVTNGVDVGHRGAFPGVHQDLLSVGASIYPSLLQIQTSGVWYST